MLGKADRKLAAARHPMFRSVGQSLQDLAVAELAWREAAKARARDRAADGTRGEIRLMPKSVIARSGATKQSRAAGLTHCVPGIASLRSQ